MHPLAFPSRGDDARLAEIGQMPGYFRLRLIENLDKVAYAYFLVPHQVQEAEPRVVSEGQKEALHIERNLLRFHVPYYIRVDVYCHR